MVKGGTANSFANLLRPIRRCRADRPGPDARIRSPSLAPARAISRMKTLLVETHALYREGLVLLITQSFPELELLQAGDIADALTQLERHPDLDLLLLDLDL